MPPQDPFSAFWCVVAALFFSLVFNLAKSAAVYIDDSALKNRINAGDKRAVKLESILAKHYQLRLAVNSASAFCLVIVVARLTLFSIQIVGRYPISDSQKPFIFWAFILVYTMLFYAIAIHSPRRIATYYPDIAYPLSGFLSLCYHISSPLTFVIGALSSLAIILTGNDPKAKNDFVTEEEIRMLVDEGNEHGTIEELEMKMINNIFDFDDRDVSQVMTHRTELSAVEINSSLDEVVNIAIESGYSRLPVYDGDIDTICGIIYAKDLIKYVHRPQDFHIADNLRKPICVPESSTCSDVFALLQREKTQIAIVVDEYGGTYGIVTMEDLLESIVGSIQDEYDNEEVTVTQIEEGVYLLDGSTSISDAELLLDFYVPDDSEADTLGGFVTELLGGVPQMPTDPRTAVFSHITFSVVSSDERKINKIRAVIEKEEKE